MKTLRTLFVIAIAIVMSAFSTKVIAQTDANTKTTAVAANILIPITLTQNSSLNFGSIGVIANQGDGTCVITTDNKRQFTGGAKSSSRGTAFSAATYTVNGEPTYTYSISLPTSRTLTRDGGSETITVDHFLAKSASGDESHAATGTLTGGTEDFSVGATLTLPSDVTPGQYNGDFQISVNYN